MRGMKDTEISPHLRDPTLREVETSNSEDAVLLPSIIESSVDAVYCHDLNGRILTWNKNAEALYGYRAAEIIGQDVVTLSPTGKEQIIYDIVAASEGGASIIPVETERRRKDGTLFHALLTTSPIRDVAGKVAALSTIVQDITKQKYSEETLYNFEQKLRAIFDGTHEYLGLIAPDGTLLEANRAFLAFAASSRDEVIGMPFWKTVWFQFTPGAPEAVRDAVTRAAEGEFIRFETPIKLTSGEVKTFSISFDPVCDQEGKVVFIVPLGYDITDRKRAEEALRHTEQLHRVSFELAPTGMVYVSPDGNITAVNERMCELTGYSADELVRMKVQDLTHPADREHDAELVNPFLRGETPSYENEKRYLRKDGGIRWVAVVARMVTDAEGRPIHTVGVVQDVTDRKAIAEQLLESEEFNRTVLESSPDCVKVLDASGRLLMMNGPGLCAMEIDDPALFLGKNWWDLWPEQCRPQIETALDQVLHGEVAHFEGFCPTAKGTPKLWDVGVAPVRSANGAIERIVAISRDVTERKLTEVALAQGEARIRLATEATGVGIWEWNVITGKVRWNTQMFRIYGIDPTDDGLVEYSTWTGAVLPEDLPRQEEMLQKTIRGLENSCREFRIRRPNEREYRHIQSVETVLTNAYGQAEWLLGTNLDITERKQADQDLRRANLDLEQFAFTASHDLQEPLRNMAVYSQLFEECYGQNLDEDGKQMLGFIVEGAHRMGALVSDLLAYTQLTSLDQEPAMPLDVGKVFGHVLKGLQRILEESHATITYDLLPTVLVKEIHLQQLLQNLLGNALKYCKDDEPPQIHVSTMQQDKFWRFSIKDNGIGIAPEYQGQIFGLFKRLHDKGSKYSGTGIGLAICQKIVERYGGRIWVESKLNQGTTFHFTIPAVPAE